MGIKKRNKISAEFSMSSLTDIIFLLLIFFMLTSTLIRIQPFDLPESSSKTVAPTSITVSIDKKGTYMVNNVEHPAGRIKSEVLKSIQGLGDPDSKTITIVAEVGVPWRKVSEIVKIASELRTRAIIATQNTEK